MDLNNDGKLDVLSGSYSGEGLKEMAGTFQVLWGIGKGSFQAPTELKGEDGKLLLIEAGKVEDPAIKRICTRPTAIDWNGDGKLDIISGNFEGTFALFIGKGNGIFESKHSWIEANGKPLHLEQMHSDPVIVDIDQDGDLDLLSGSAVGGVYWAKNKTKDVKKIRFDLEPFIPLIDPPKDPVVKKGTPARPGMSSRIWIEDINNDKKLDILLGDTINQESVKEGIDKNAYEKWKKEKDELMARAPKTNEEYQKMNDTERKAFELKHRNIMKLQNRFINSVDLGHIWIYQAK